MEKLNKNDAKAEIKAREEWLSQEFLIIPVHCYKNDLIAVGVTDNAGNESAVFTKVFVPPGVLPQ